MACGHGRQSWAKFSSASPTGNPDVRVMTPYLSALSPGEQKYRSVWSRKKTELETTAERRHCLNSFSRATPPASLPPPPPLCCLISSCRINLKKHLFCLSYFHHKALVPPLFQVSTGRRVLGVFSGVFCIFISEYNSSL